MKKPISSKPTALTLGVSEILQEHREDASAEWIATQDKLAAATGLSLLLVDGRQPPALVVSNNNSICQAFQTSPDHVGLCDPYCGDAHRRALSAGSAVQYKCHAGLQCVTMPVQIGGEQNVAVIGGRAFVSATDYRALVDRFRAGELNELLDKGPFENVIFAEQQRLDDLPERIRKATRKLIPKSPTPSAQASVQDQARETPAIAAAEYEGTREGVPVQATTEQPALARSQVDLQMEVDRLRDELKYRSHLVQSLQSFLDRISSTDPDETYLAILTHSKELLGAARAALLLYDEGSTEARLKASVGFPADEPSLSPEGILTASVGVSADPKLDGPTDTEQEGSFISYPITVRGRRIGLLNFTAKTGGGKFTDVDLSLLEIIAPQIAVALERADWQERATQFQLMSITDPLTGLLNRRYLEERLTEELNRSTRHSYPMSCLMIDIDDFKKYNDRNGHQAGDVALKITAHSLKASLRSADVACRYGGEEFCVLLPQTSVSEAGVIAERMRLRVAETVYPFGKQQPMGTVSISIGISTFAKNIDTAEKIIAAADRALYHAKAEGKNRIEFYAGHLAGAFAGK